MAKLTPEQIAAAQARGASVTVTPKHVKVSEPIKLDGIADVVLALRQMAEAQQRSQQIMIETLSNVVAAIDSKGLNSSDIAGLAAAVRSLKQEVVTESNTPMDYRVDFERDQRGLMRSGITFTAVPRRLN